MPFNDKNEWIDADELVLAASAERSADGQGSAIDLGDRGTPRLTLDVTAAGGTAPSLAVAIETSADGSTWRELGAFTALSAVGSQRCSFPGADRYVRAAWYLAGTTPAFTFSVSGNAA